MAPFPLPLPEAKKKKRFFSDIYCKKLIEFMEVNLKIW